MTLEEEIKAVVESLGATLYDIESTKVGNRALYQIFITKAGGVDVELCAEISRILSPLLDVKPPIAGEYTLEVSSAGIERKLKCKEHFLQAVGEDIKFTTWDKKRHKGKLTNADEDGFELDGQRFEYSSVTKANVVFDWKK